MNLQQNSEFIGGEQLKKTYIKPPQINGFTQRANIQQILSYIIVAALFFVYTFCVLPILSLAAQIVSGILFYGSFTIMFVLGYLCTNFDPTDIHVIEEKTAKLNNQEYDTSNLDFYCMNCTTHVSNNSKHCKACNRCVANFDHHCKWLNNCIGQANYSLFFKLIATVLINSTVFTLFGCIALFTHYLGNDSNKEIDHKLFFHGDSDAIVGVFEILIWIFIIISFLIAFFDGNLVFFHVYLRKMKLTTYQYIISSREKKQMEENQSNERKQERKRQEEEKLKQKAQKKKELQNQRRSSQTNSIIGGGNNNNKNSNYIQNTLKQNTQSSYIMTPSQNNNVSINFQNGQQVTNTNNNNINLNAITEERNLGAVSRQDSIDTHSQRTNLFEFTDSKRGTIRSNQLNSQYNLKKTTTKKGFWEKICCCFKSKQNEAKIGVIGLTKIDEQSEFMDEKDDQNEENFAIIEELNQRGICQTIDVMDEIQKMKPIQSTKQINFEMPNPEIYFQKIVNVVGNTNNNFGNNNSENPTENGKFGLQKEERQFQNQFDRIVTEEQHLKDVPQDAFAQKSQTDLGGNTLNQININPDLEKKKSAIDILSVNLTQKSSEVSPNKERQKEEDDDHSIDKNGSKDALRHKKQHIPPKNLSLYLRQSSKSSLKSNQMSSSHGEGLEMKTEEKHNSIPPSQILPSKDLNLKSIQIKQNSSSMNEIPQQLN